MEVADIQMIRNRQPFILTFRHQFPRSREVAEVCHLEVEVFVQKEILALHGGWQVREVLVVVT
jgi:hypothetical protein